MSAEDNPDTLDAEVLIVTGLSGAGRSTAAKVLEDSGWYVVDNVPTALVERMLDVTASERAAPVKLAVVLRSVGAGFASEVRKLIADLSAARIPVRTVFLDASDTVLVRRFEQVRRRHPLQENGTLVSAIERERSMLAPIAESATLVIDTSALPISRLREILDDAYAQASETRLRVVCESFGFKYGLPIDADLVVDVRFLPNPYWDSNLRQQDGRDEPVRDYVLSAPGAEEFLVAYERVVRLITAGYRREGKRYMTVAVGCTGGKHRSVAVSSELASRLSAPAVGGDAADDVIDQSGLEVRVVHRDVGRE